MVSAVAIPDKLFCQGKPDSDPNEIHNNGQSVEPKDGETYGIDVAQSNRLTVGELASVRELQFAFRRAASSLIEMCSKTWWQKYGFEQIKYPNLNDLGNFKQ